MPSKLRLPVRGYHGTTLNAAYNIKNDKAFKREEREWHWLGQGVYFWQDAPLRAWEWAEHKALEERASGKQAEPAVVSATIDLTECLDLLDMRFWPLVDMAWMRVSQNYTSKGQDPPSQIGPLEAFACAAFLDLIKIADQTEEEISVHAEILRALVPTVWSRLASKIDGNVRQIDIRDIRADVKRRYGKNQRDCDVIDGAVEILEEYRTPVSTARAAFMEGDAPYHGSWFRDRSHVQVAVVDPNAIQTVLSELDIEDSDWLRREYTEITRSHSTTWMRKMK